MRQLLVRPRHALTAAVIGTTALLLLTALDHAATRRQLAGVLRAQAATLTHTIAAAARAHDAAGGVARELLAARLLDVAHGLERQDRARGLGDEDVAAAVARQALFRVSVHGVDGRVERSAGAPRGGPGHGWGRGRGERGQGLVDQILGGRGEAVTDIHAPRHGDGARVAAGVRRTRGGAIVVAADAGEVADLLRPSALDALLAELTARESGIAFIELRRGNERAARGPVPPAPPGVAGEREIEVHDRPVLETWGEVDAGGGAPSSLRVGLRLDEARRAERRMLATLAAVLAAGMGTAALAVGTLWLRRRYELLSAEHARAEEQLRRRDRLAAMGSLAATVAHQVRNPLNAIAMSVQRLRREFVPAGAEAERAEAAELVDTIDAGARRVDDVVEGFLAHARAPVVQLAPADLAAVAQEALRTLAGMAEQAGVALATEGSSVVGDYDAQRLREVVENLVRNALEATAPGGRVAVRTDGDEREARLSVADDGAGIPPEVLPRVFDLYFTTRPEGNGIGLAWAQQVVSAHGGTIDVESHPGRGARFTVRLPRGAARA